MPWIIRSMETENSIMWDLGFHSGVADGMLHRVDWQAVTDVSESHSAFSFKVKQSKKSAERSSLRTC